MNRKSFFDAIRETIFGGTMSPSQVAGVNAILAACEGWRLTWTAYALATAYHETAYTMQPIKERGGPEYYNHLYGIEGDDPVRAKKHGNINPGDGARFCGRGFVQLTWRSNYMKAGDKIGVDLVSNPDAAMELDNAAAIMRGGMEEGWFTRRKLTDFLTDSKTDYVNARRVINGTDKAIAISGYARAFDKALHDAGYGHPVVLDQEDRPVAAVIPESSIETKTREWDAIGRQAVGIAGSGSALASLFAGLDWRIVAAGIIVAGLVAGWALWVRTRAKK